MSGNTRYGFTGQKDVTDDVPPGAEPVRGAPTMFGRMVHRPDLIAKNDAVAPPGPVEEGAPQDVLRLTPPPPAAPLAGDERPLYTPSHTGKTGLRAVARFFGRRNTHGEFEPAGTSSSELAIAHQPWISVRQLVVVLVAASASFLIVSLLSWRQSARRTTEASAIAAAPPAPSASRAAPPPPAPEPDNVPSAPASAAVRPARPATIPPASPARLDPPAGNNRPAALRGQVLPRKKRKLDPDAPLPFVF